MGQGPIKDFQLIKDYSAGRGEPDEFFRLHIDVTLSPDDYAAFEQLLAAQNYAGIYNRLAQHFVHDPRWEGALATFRAALTTPTR